MANPFPTLPREDVLPFPADAVGLDGRSDHAGVRVPPSGSGEGQNGTISELLAQNGIPTTVDMHIEALEEIGGLDVLGSPKTDNQYHAGWAWAGSTPYKGMDRAPFPFEGSIDTMSVRYSS